MTDLREDILARLFEIMQTQTGITTTVRNRGLMQNEQRPATALLDGDETVRVSINNRRTANITALPAPQIMEMRPQIFFLPKEKRPTNSAGAGIGPEANAWRIDMLAKIWGDVELAALLGSNGNLVYNGCETDLKSGSAMSGEIRLDFVVNYVLKPTA